VRRRNDGVTAEFAAANEAIACSAFSRHTPLMSWFRERWSVIVDGVGARRFTIGAIFTAVVTFVVYLANALNEPAMVSRFVPWLIAVVVLAILVAWWMVEFAVKLRRQLRGAVDLEQALDTLSRYFDEGNNQIFNASVKNAMEYGTWKVLWKQWYEKVESHLESTLGLRERNLFKNIVLYSPVSIPQSFDASHNQDLNVLYRQLETIRDVVIRHSERADQWRIRGLELRSS
jgi:hypothetical protein